MPPSLPERAFTLTLIALLAWLGLALRALAQRASGGGGIIGGVLLAAIALTLFFLLPVPAARAEAPCTHYASPQGQGSACTEAAPCLIGTWLGDPAKAAPGAVLCLGDGHYTGEMSLLTLTSVNGSEGHPLTIRALHNGKVLIDGQFGGRPLDCNGSWITVQGVDIRDGNDTVGAIRGQHCTIQRVVAWSTQSWDGIENIWDVGGAHNLLEDVAAFGYARKMIAVGARGGPGPNTVRRAWAELNGSLPGSAGGNPTNVIEMGYDQDNVTFENVIATRDVLSSATEPEAPLTVFSTRNSALLGSIAYAKAGQTWDVTSLMAIFPEGGSHAGSGHANTNVLVQDVALVVAPTYPQIGPFWLQGGSGSAGNVLRRVVSITPGGGGGSCGTAPGWTCDGLYAGTTLAQALGTRTLWETLPGLCTRYVNRVLTSEPLWPWPMEGRILAARGAAKMPARHVTQMMTDVLGAIPTACQSGNTPPRNQVLHRRPHIQRWPVRAR